MPTTLDPHPRSTSRGRRIVAGLAMTVVSAISIGAAGCSTPAPEQPELADALVDSGLSKKVADCTASALTKSLTTAELAEITERGAGGAPVDDPKETGESADKLTEAMATCRELQAAETPTTTTTVAVAPEGGIAPTTAPATDGAELNPTPTTTAP